MASPRTVSADRSLQLLLACLLVFPAIGCTLARQNSSSSDNASLLESVSGTTKIEYPDVDTLTHSEVLDSLAPRTLDDAPPTEFWDLTLEEAIGIALRNGDVLADLGGSVVNAPAATASIFDPAIQANDPQSGVEGALSAFDAQFASNIFWANNDQALNNITIGGGTRELVQDVGAFQAQLAKVAATGTQFAIRNITQYDQNNRPSNLFISDWDTQFEASVSQPLLQGAGVTINRIAGPNATAGSAFNGVMIARINNDISLADFESSVRDFISGVEDAYWDLYLAYRQLDAQKLARESALETWRTVHAKSVKRLRGGEADNEAQARAQYYRFQDALQNALTGSPLGGETIGVYRAERQLRLLLGLSSNDGRLVRPIDDPPNAKVDFAWENSLVEAMTRRVELRRQQWQIKQRELQYTASRNFVLPRLDAFGTYRWRGFGDNLTGDGAARFASAFKDLESGDHQEWELGLQLQWTIGYRQAWAGVRQAELQLARERALLRRQELEISHGLSAAIVEVSRAHAAVRSSYNLLGAETQRRDATSAAFDADQAPLFLLLETQQRVAEAQSRYYFSLAQYAKAIKDTHLQKGTLLAYNGVYLSEGVWPTQAYRDASELSRRLRAKFIDYRFSYPGPVSRGTYPQALATEAEELPPPDVELDLDLESALRQQFGGEDETADEQDD